MIWFQALKDGIDVNIRHPLGWTALHTAAINNKAEIIKVLLDNGADINAGDNFVNVYKTAMEKGLHSLDGILFNISMKYNILLILKFRNVWFFLYKIYINKKWLILI